MTGPAPRPGAREALIATAALLTLLAVGKSAAAALPFLKDWVFTAAAAFQLYVPLWLVQRGGEPPESHRIHAHGLLLGPVAALRKRRVAARRSRRPGGARRSTVDSVLAYYGRGASLNARGLFRDVGLALGFALVTFPLFAVGHWAWTRYLHQAPVPYALRLPENLGEILLVNVFLVGLPEEMFYRGFLETRLERLWPTRFTVLLVPISRTVILASALFALGHFFGEWNPARLGPFFPAFLFSAVARTSGSIAGAVLLHGLSNAFSATLLAGYMVR